MFASSLTIALTESERSRILLEAVRIQLGYLQECLTTLDHVFTTERAFGYPYTSYYYTFPGESNELTVVDGIEELFILLNRIQIQ